MLKANWSKRYRRQVVALNNQGLPTDASTFISNVTQLLQEGERRIKLSGQHKRALLLLGNSGCGKSTLALVISGSELESVKKSSSFVIKDRNEKICIESTVDSCTEFPDLLVDPSTGEAVYDCPGFKDSRGTSREITATYSIKKVVDHLKSVKLVFVTNHSSLISGYERETFMLLVRHVTSFVKDIEKFKNSIFLIANKVANPVDNGSCDGDGRCALLPDNKIISGIGSFLEEVKQSSEQKLKSSDVSSEQKVFYKNAIKFINILLEKEGTNYTRIGIFRIPTKSGPINNITLLKGEKEYIKNILYRKLNFTEKNNEDFGYTVSDAAKNSMHYLVNNINENVRSNVDIIAKQILNHYQHLVGQMRNKINYFASSSQMVYVSPSEAKSFENSFDRGKNIIKKLQEEVENIPIDNLSEKINNSITTLGIDGCQHYISIISSQGKHFRFLQDVNDKILDTKKWDDPFINVITYLSTSSRDVQNDINVAEEKLNITINSNICSIGEEIKKHYLKKMQSLEIHKVISELNKGYKVMLNMTQGIEHLGTTEELSRKIEDTVSKLDIDTLKIRGNTFNIFNSGNYLQFLQIARGEKSNIWSSDWITPFKKTAKSIGEQEKFYLFLNDLYNKLSKYSVQRNKVSYSTDTITRDKFKKFFGKIKELNITEYTAVENIDVNEFELGELNKVLDLTLRHNIDKSCQSGKLVLKGDYVKFSDFVGINGRLVELCEDGLKSVHIFALNTLFVDANLEAAGKNLSVIAIAPKWEVIDSKKINLSGIDGKAHDPPKANNSDNGYSLRKKGTDGEPGSPGGSSGSFFGIGAEFINGKMLSIIANGGSGGPGQDGGDGSNGTDGSTPKTDPSYYMNIYPCSSNQCEKTIIDFECKVMPVNPFYVPAAYPADVTILNITFYGEYGQDGTNGGNGGHGGIGGEPGNIKLVKLVDDPRMSISNSSRSGNIGMQGKGGIRGAKGKSGDNIKMECQRKEIWGITAYLGWEYKGRENGRESVSSAINGIDGVNLNGRKYPEPAAVISNPANIINDYKSYLRGSINDKFKRHLLTQFLIKMEGNDAIKDTYDELGYTDELYGLEAQFHSLNKENLVLFYQSFLDRISEYAKSIKNDNQHKKHLVYLYTAALSKVYDLKTNPGSTLIINVKGYLDIVERNIENLSRLKEKNKKVEIINKYTENYKNSIDKKIKEARGFIEEDITLEIDRINNQIDVKLDLLVNETIALQKDAAEKRDKLLMKNQELCNVLALRRFFGALKITGQVVSFLGPQGAFAGATIAASTSIAESFVLDDNTSEQTPLVLPPSITADSKLVGDQVKSIKDYRVAKFNKQLEEVSKELNQTPIAGQGSSAEAIKSINKKISYMQIKLQYKNRDELHIEELENELKQELQRKEGMLKNAKNSADKDAATVTERIVKCNRIIQISAVGFDIYSKYKGDEAKLKTISDAITHSEENIEGIKQLKSKIYSHVAPMLENIEKDLKEIKSKLGTKSQVALDVTRWQVQNSLRDMKLEISQFTKNFKVKDNFERCIEKLEEAMTTLINVYDRIHNYQEQQNLANYIAAISTSHSTDTWHEAQGKLEILIRSNIILKQYETAINALKQWAFPFADYYLKSIPLPSDLKLNLTNIDDTASEAILQLKSLKLKVDESKVSVQDFDQYIIRTIFDSNDGPYHPFFVWKNNENKDVITKLLSGEEIVVKADLKRSALDKDAIKFSLIEINLKSTNATTQKEIDKKLEKFKVILSHLGNSYYRFDGRFYVITSESQNIEYGFKKGPGGIRMHKNEVYNKINGGDLMLSPYAMWKIQISSDATVMGSFDELKMYKDAVDLELVGKGSYVSIKADASDLKIEDYYKSDDTIVDNGIYVQYASKEQARDGTSQIPDTTLSKHDRHRRSIDTPATSSAIRPTSWIGSLFQFGKELIGKATNLYNNPAAQEPHSINYNHLPLEPTVFSDSPQIGEASLNLLLTGPTVPEVDDQWFKNTDLSGLLTWGILLARKLTGYRPKALKDVCYHHEMDTELGTQPYEWVDAFMDRVQFHAQACGIEQAVSDTVENLTLYTQAIKTVRKKLAAKEPKTIVASLFDQIVLHNISKIASKPTPNQANKLLAKIREDLPNMQQQFLKQEDSPRAQSEEDMIANATLKANISTLKQEMPTTQPINQLVGNTALLDSTYNKHYDIITLNEIDHGNRYRKCGSL